MVDIIWCRKEVGSPPSAMISAAVSAFAPTAHTAAMLIFPMLKPAISACPATSPMSRSTVIASDPLRAGPESKPTPSDRPAPKATKAVVLGCLLLLLVLNVMQNPSSPPPLPDAHVAPAEISSATERYHCSSRIPLSLLAGDDLHVPCHALQTVGRRREE